MKPEEKSPVSRPRILVVKLSSLGDLFHALPTVHLLKKQLQAEVDWVTQPEYVPLVRCFTEVNRVLSFPRKNILRGLPNYLREVRRERYDYILDMQGLLKSAAAARLARGGKRIGPSYQREGARLFYHHVAGVRDKNRHAVEEALDVARFLNVPVDEIVFPTAFPDFQLQGDAPRVALIPCSRWVTKNAPIALFAGVGRLLLERGVQSVFIAGGPDDASVCERLAAEISSPQVFNLCGKTTLPELGSILSQMDLVITVDSGPMHLAAASGARVAAIFGATDPQRTGPYGDGHVLITEENLDCRPCLSRTCRRGDLACLNRTTPERIVERIEQSGALTLRTIGEPSS